LHAVRPSAANEPDMRIAAWQQEIKRLKVESE
jgi:uncharacterized small protein (DUF1192 family)